MSSLPRRAALVLGTLVAVVFALALPAQAQFSGQTARPALTVGSVTVKAPTGLTTAGSTCDVDGTLHLKLGWTQSTTARVSSYKVRGSTLFGLINLTLGSVPASSTSLSTDLPQNSLGYSFSVTTVTDYGWTAESAQTGTIRC